ncbi:hypothetical protein F5146DRAFT_997779 [Armillaria mellea]|nr:hypothetical protein F5146DRAFT_997779 [Armillaria mellea]
MDTALQRSLNTGCALDCLLILSYTGQQQIWTGDPQNSWADCMAIHDERIVAIGPLQEVHFEWNTYTATLLPDIQLPRFSNLGIIELGKGAIIIPGLMMRKRPSWRVTLPLLDAANIKVPRLLDVVKTIREFVVGPMGSQDKTECIRGSGWNMSLWNHCIWPTAKDLELDPVIRGRPIILESESHHAIWVSSAVLKDLAVRKKLWIHRVHSGDILKDTKGEPTGVFLNGAATIINDVFPITDQEKRRMFSVAARQARRFGMTAVHDPDPNSTDLYKSFACLQEENTTIILHRFLEVAMNHMARAHLGYPSVPLISQRKKCVKEGWTVVTHKLLISGRLKAELLRQVFDRDNEANEIMMSAIEAMACLPSETDCRVFRSNGIKVILGSDTPVEGLNPLRIFQSGVSMNEGEHAKGKARREDLERHRIQILKEMTMNAAFTTFSDTELGSLEPGKYADFVLISQNILDPGVSLSSIANTRVLGTVIGGRVVYGTLADCFSRADGMLARQYTEEFRSVKLYD